MKITLVKVVYLAIVLIIFIAGFLYLKDSLIDYSARSDSRQQIHGLELPIGWQTKDQAKENYCDAITVVIPPYDTGLPFMSSRDNTVCQGPRNILATVLNYTSVLIILSLVAVGLFFTVQRAKNHPNK